MMTTILVVLAFCFLVGFHEFGHLVIAKLLGMKVDAFSIGFGPKLLKFNLGETEYSLSLFPLGGYVKPAGPDFAEDLNPDDSNNNRYFITKPVWKRFLVIAAGPTFNLLLAFLIISGVVYSAGIQEPST